MNKSRKDKVTWSRMFINRIIPRWRVSRSRISSQHSPRDESAVTITVVIMSLNGQLITRDAHDLDKEKSVCT